MEYTKIEPWILGVIGIPIEIQDRCCPDLFIFKPFILISIWEVFENASAS